MGGSCFPARVTLFAFLLACTVGGFVGGLWAGAAIGLALILFFGAWLRDSRPVPVPSLRAVLAGAAAGVGIAALLAFLPKLRKGLGGFTPVLVKLAAPGLAFILAARRGRSWEDVKRGLPRPERGFLYLALAALAVMGLSGIYSIQPGLSEHKALQMASIYLPLLALSCEGVKARAAHPKLFLWLPLAIAITALLLGIELRLGTPLLDYVRGGSPSPTQYNRGASYLVLLALPATAGLWAGGERNRRLLILPLLIALLFLGGETESRASKLALLLALPATGLALWRVEVTAWLLAAVPPVLLGWPFFARAVFDHHQDWLRRLPPSWQARVEIWDYLSYRVAEHPVLGWGLGTTHLLDWLQPHGAAYSVIFAAAPHPHNAVIQLWVELGIPGLILGLAFAFYSLYRAARLESRAAPFALGAWVAALALALCAYDLWTDATWGCVALTGFAFALLDRRLRLIP